MLLTDAFWSTTCKKTGVVRFTNDDVVHTTRCVKDETIVSGGNNNWFVPATTSATTCCLPAPVKSSAHYALYNITSSEARVVGSAH